MSIQVKGIKSQETAYFYGYGFSYYYSYGYFGVQINSSENVME
ncbi:hypothetical protein [Alkalibacter mobilis]|nr:hypothetical protein [Alkalibacter mobilis]